MRVLRLSSTCKNLEIKIYRAIIVPALLVESETQFPILREGHRLRLFEHRVLRRIFVRKQEARENCIMRSFMICTLQ
jgi:hypothetical protein